MALDAEAYRRMSRDVWDRMASGWFREREWMWETSRGIGEKLVERLDPRPGQTILELAAGTGDTGFAAAAALGPDGRLIVSDFSPAAVDAAQERARELGVTNAEFRVLDAEQLALADDSVDGVLCRWGYMLMADPAAALRETRRVLRDGGRLCFSVWAGPAGNPWATVPGQLLVERAHVPPPAPGQPGLFALADPERIRSLLRDAGFGDPELEEVPFTWRFGDFDGFWAFLTDVAGAIALQIDGLPEAEREAVRAGIRERLEGPDGAGYDLAGLCWNATAS